MLRSFDREDLETLWKLVKAKHRYTRLEEGYERVLWGDLKTMFEHHVEDLVWRNLQGNKVLVWKLFDSCGVHFVRFQSLHVFMLVEKRYPLTLATITEMLNKKLQADHWNEMWSSPHGFPIRGSRRRKGRIILPDAGVEIDDIESWTLFTDGASSLKGSKEGLVLIGPSGIEYTYSLWLTFPSTNNKAEYEALLAGLRITRKINISKIEVKVNSKLVASQINESYKSSKDSMIKYLAKAKEYISGFKSFSIENIPRNMNQKADVLSKIVSVAFNHLTKEVLVEILNERSTECQEVHTIVEEEGDN
ncbi:reverse transcriptase domain-containing protein [Tanacetum coccineum]